MKDIFKKESDYVLFDPVYSKYKVIFKVANEGNVIIDRSGNADTSYGVKFEDLEKRARKLRRNGVEPDETERAIRHFRMHSVNAYTAD